MTRINAGIDPEELPTKLLLAERRELIRIPNAIKKGNVKLNDIPKDFRLGTGHVKFFYNKIGYLKNRYQQITKECINRSLNISDFSTSFIDIPCNLMNDWEPTLRDRNIIIERINQRGFKLLTIDTKG